MKKSVFLPVLPLLLSLMLCGCEQLDTVSDILKSLPKVEIITSVTPSPEPTPEPEIALSCGSFPISTEELCFTPEKSDFAQLESFPALSRAEFTGGVCLDEILAYKAAHPYVSVSYSVSLPDGSSVGVETSMLDFSDYTDDELDRALSLLRYLPELKTLKLPDAVEESSMSLDKANEIADACPGLKLDFGFELYGVELRSTDTEIDLWHVPVSDAGAEVMKALRVMPDCTYLDMDKCGVENEDMAFIRDSFPNVKVVWRVSFGENYSVRTDVEKILASKPSIGGDIFPHNSGALKYCTDVKYLDLGHNEGMVDVSFLEYMPKLEVLVIAMGGVKDISPLRNLTNLEYLEIQTNVELKDLSPLANLTNLEHLNIGWLFDVDDITPLYNLTKLKRLMIGSETRPPEEQIEKFKELVPDCEVDTWSYDPTAGFWRYLDYDEVKCVDILAPRYELLIKQFGYDKEDYCFYWRDPLYFDEGENVPW